MRWIRGTSTSYIPDGCSQGELAGGHLRSSRRECTNGRLPGCGHPLLRRSPEDFSSLWRDPSALTSARTCKFTRPKLLACLHAPEAMARRAGRGQQRRTLAVRAAVATVVGLVVALAVVSSRLPGAQASLPPVECDAGGQECTVVSSYRVWPDRKACKFSRVHYPSTEEELVAAVAAAVRSGSKLRVVSKWSHSIPKLVCPAGDGGVLISTRDYNRTVRVDREALTVTVDAGVMVKDLVGILAEQGVALTHLPYWSGLSISGLLATGAHGSSLVGKGSAVHEYVTGVRIVVPAPADQGYAVVKSFTEDANPKQLAAAKVSLGVLGAISQVTLQVEPLFKRSLSMESRDDADLESRLPRLGQEQEFGDVMWRASQGQAGYRLDHRVPDDTAGDGAYDFIPPMPVAAVQGARAAALAWEASGDRAAKCAAAAALLALSAAGFGAVNNRSTNVFEGYPVVGLANHIQVAGSCSDGPEDADNPANPSNKVCALFDLSEHGGVFGSNVAVSVPLARVGDVVADFKRLVRARPQAFCEVDLSGFGILMRFVKGPSSAHLGVAEDAVDVDFFFLRADQAHTPRLDQDVFEEMEQLLLFKYGGKPHWGKNRPIAFAGVAAKYPALRQFLEVKAELDPLGLFSNEWTDAVLGIRGHVTPPVKQPFCALEGLCVCSEDVHCAPEAGYVCRPGLVYKQAQVCRFEPAQQGGDTNLKEEL